MENYGKELIIDLHQCDASRFNRQHLRAFCKILCDAIGMKRGTFADGKNALVFWDDIGVPKKYKQTEEHTKGTSAIQFILTSNITIHTLDLMKRVYINIFSCKDFDADAAARLTQDFFGGQIIKSTVIDRI